MTITLFRLTELIDIVKDKVLYMYKCAFTITTIHTKCIKVPIQISNMLSPDNHIYHWILLHEVQSHQRNLIYTVIASWTFFVDQWDITFDKQDSLQAVNVMRKINRVIKHIAKHSPKREHVIWLNNKG